MKVLKIIGLLFSTITLHAIIIFNCLTIITKTKDIFLIICMYICLILSSALFTSLNIQGIIKIKNE